MQWGCRKDLPTDEDAPVYAPRLHFSAGDYFTYSNKSYNQFGTLLSEYRSSTTVVDTGRVLNGRSGVAVLIDSLFTPGGAFAHRDSVLLHVDASGDLYRFGFIAWVASRETMTVSPRWDKLVAFSLPLGSSWTVGRIDSVHGYPAQTVFGSSTASTEYVAATVNGTRTALTTHRVELTKANQTLNLMLWMSGAPSAFARAVDDSYVIPTTDTRELVEARTAP